MLLSQSVTAYQPWTNDICNCSTTASSCNNKNREKLALWPQTLASGSHRTRDMRMFVTPCFSVQCPYYWPHQQKNVCASRVAPVVPH